MQLDTLPDLQVLAQSVSSAVHRYNQAYWQFTEFRLRYPDFASYLRHQVEGYEHIVDSSPEFIASGFVAYGNYEQTLALRKRDLANALEASVSARKAFRAGEHIFWRKIAKALKPLPIVLQSVATFRGLAGIHGEAFISILQSLVPVCERILAAIKRIKSHFGKALLHTLLLVQPLEVIEGRHYNPWDTVLLTQARARSAIQHRLLPLCNNLLAEDRNRGQGSLGSTDLSDLYYIPTLWVDLEVLLGQLPSTVPLDFGLATGEHTREVTYTLYDHSCRLVS
jgi:hypothetical protein